MPDAARKAIHTAAVLCAAAVAWFAPADAARVTLVAAAALAFAIDVARRRIAAVGRVFQAAVGRMLRSSEHHRMTGATTMAVGFAATAVLFPTDRAAIAFLCAGLGDAAAALVGRRFGRRPLRSGKSIEGASACFAVAFAVALAAPSIGLTAALAVAAVITAAELLIRTADNFWLPLAAAATLVLLA